jgi:hypothetical protein
LLERLLTWSTYAIIFYVNLLLFIIVISSEIFMNMSY